MNLCIKIKPNTDIEWLFAKLFCISPSLKEQGIIHEVTMDGIHISILVSVNDKEAESFKREVILISSQIISVQRA